MKLWTMSLSLASSKFKYEFLDNAWYLNSRGSERAATMKRAMRKVVNPLAELSQLRAGSHHSPTRPVLSHPAIVAAVESRKL